MLIEGAGVVAHRPTPVLFFTQKDDEKYSSHSNVCSAVGRMQYQSS